MSVREYKGIIIDDSRDEKFTQFGKKTLEERYLLLGETFQELFARVAVHFSDSPAHAQRMYDYMSNHWFMPSTPILSNGGTDRGLAISCFLNETNDSLDGMWDLYRENMRLAAAGGGIGSYWGNVRSIGERAGSSGKTSGVIPFIKAMDSQTLAVSQGSLRRGSAAVYMQVDHPEIEEFLQIRKPSGGDPNRKCLNLHHGICITDAFMHAVEEDAMWALRSPKTREVIREVSARTLFSRILETRIETGEPYLLFIDTVNRSIPEWHKRDEYFVKTSNLCSEIVLHTNAERTAVCCLSSLNLETYKEWRPNRNFIIDVMRFLDNVLQDFIEQTAKNPKYAGLKKANFSASQERSVGLGVMGFHSFLQQMNVSFESDNARHWNQDIWKKIKAGVDEASRIIAREKGPCPDAARHGFVERFSNKTSVAPTASISIITGGASPGIEPMAANAYTHKTLSGSFLVKNQYLEKVLEKCGHNDQETWSSIIVNRGSVQHLDFLSVKEKELFKTATELNQNWIIRHAADRAPFIDQAASNNLFFRADADKSDVLSAHFRAWKEGVKSLYYCRSQSLQQASNVGQKIERVKIIDDSPPDVNPRVESDEERALSDMEKEAERFGICESCQ